MTTKSQRPDQIDPIQNSIFSHPKYDQMVIDFGLPGCISAWIHHSDFPVNKILISEFIKILEAKYMGSSDPPVMNKLVDDFLNNIEAIHFKSNDPRVKVIFIFELLKSLEKKYLESGDPHVKYVFIRELLKNLEEKYVDRFYPEASHVADFIIIMKDAIKEYENRKIEVCPEESLE